MTTWSRATDHTLEQQQPEQQQHVAVPLPPLAWLTPFPSHRPILCTIMTPHLLWHLLSLYSSPDPILPPHKLQARRLCFPPPSPPSLPPPPPSPASAPTSSSLFPPSSSSAHTQNATPGDSAPGGLTKTDYWRDGLWPGTARRAL